ncbi:MAG: phosphate acyltransferase PlsX [Nitrospira sp.]|nr:phosphate acyltransferase PlsX [Candidatus Manganitrophaceae bacterium]HIL33884.1 phosphate acyltransferase PlsX [Candidatus Manganitrophaceae bacterium]
MKIALDAMGGDHAPETIVEGAVLAARDLDVEIILVGDEKKVETALSRHVTTGLPLSIVHASQKVEMEDSPSSVIRKKRNSSIWIATELVKKSEAVAVISAGNTGATMASSLFVLGPLSGVERPAIATLLPTLKGQAVLIDVGANVDCKPQHLFQFAIMGAMYAEKILGIPEPSVGLLSIGEEDTKGNELTKEVFKMLKKSSLAFVGNVEGRDVYSGDTDVVVCDGFIGNVALKISEGLSDAIIKFLKREIMASPMGKLGYFFLKPSFARFKKKIDYAEYGGAPLLGVDGITIICHGNSSGHAIMNAVRVARDFHKKGMNRHIKEQIGTQMQLSSPLVEKKL